MSEDWRADPRTNEELLRVALTAEDDDRIFQAIEVLRQRGGPDTFEAARLLPALERLAQAWGGYSEAGVEDDLYTMLEEAIAACQPRQED